MEVCYCHYSVDGNNEIFPVVVGVVESENKESWCNFFWHLKQVLAESGREDWTIISDRQKGIEPALEQVWPSCYRRFCARHLCKNFKKDYPGLLMHKLFWKLVNSYSEFTFKKSLESLVQHGGLGCGSWFSDLGDHETWARYRFDPRVSNDENTSNFVESFNSTLGIHRNNPVLSLLEGIRRMSMVRHATRAQIADSWPDDGICPNIRQRLKVFKKESRFVRHLHHRPRLDDEVAYGSPILPISDSPTGGQVCSPNLGTSNTEEVHCGPSRNRRREPGEQRKGKRSNTVKCKKCGCFGHNSKTCKGGYTAKEKRQLNIQTRSQVGSVSEIGEGSQSQSHVGTSLNAPKGKKRKIDLLNNEVRHPDAMYMSVSQFFG
ncbi:uncharacterized protein LOC141641210 [Silene latifolia]|uniref:uncharacterized protein LOC141641210 n=1 Tax=Silene latifolia TaxID=37657 RepID=UPI003D775820